MIYLKSTEHEVMIRIDEEADVAYIKQNGQEIQAEPGSKIVADANLENNEISEEEYQSGQSETVDVD